jgi:MFS family permease
VGLDSGAASFCRFSANAINFKFDLAPTTIATLITLSGLLSILLASKLTQHINRRWVIVTIMAFSATTSIALALSLHQTFGAVFAIAIFYRFIVTANSGIINAGLLALAEPARHGTSMEVHATLSFIAAFLMPFLFGTILDFAGGENSAQAWLTAFAAMATFIAIGPLALFVLDRD